MNITSVPVPRPRASQASGVRLAALPPLSLYVHLPWCLKKCPYCDFNSHERTPDAAMQRAYLDALITDLEAALPSIWGRRVQTIFIGGGTPSLFAPQAIDELLAAIRARLPMEPGAEITLEANPGTFERERFKAYRSAGVTRLSIGVQSFNDPMLQAVGRVHDAAQARAAVAEAAEAFDTFNIDLMYALPGQSLAMLQEDLATALSFAPPHLSIYHLTMEPNTRFAVQPPPNLPDDDAASDMLDAIVQATAVAGLQRYEVSAFARPGHRAAHNLNYWAFGDYLGIGAGAHSKLSFPGAPPGRSQGADAPLGGRALRSGDLGGSCRITRQVRWRDPATYMAKAVQQQAVSNDTPVTTQQLPFEFMLNALRLVEGVPTVLFEERTGQSPAVLAAALREAVARGLLNAHPARFQATPRGMDFLSDLQALFL
jgi:putative oxygen-independent coproporphyrinogen III oxidase